VEERFWDVSPKFVSHLFQSGTLIHGGGRCVAIYFGEIINNYMMGHLSASLHGTFASAFIHGAIASLSNVRVIASLSKGNSYTK
jgi:hypothetical protein